MMQEVFWVERNMLGGRPGPTRVEWSAEELRSAGIRAILNVSEHEFPTDACRQFGLEVSWIPMPVTVPPGDRDEDECLRALPEAEAFLSGQLAADNAVLVHCVRGCDRTGLVLAHHLAISEGLSAAEAISKVRIVRPEALTADGWESMAERVIGRLRGPT